MRICRLVLACVAVMLIANLPAIGGEAVEEKPIVLYDSKKLEKFAGVDQQGVMIVGPYKGERITLDMVVDSVRIKPTGPSIVVENDFVVFDITCGQPMPKGLEKTTRLKLWFDEHNLMQPKQFAKGEKWKVTLTPKGELVSFDPCPENQSDKKD